MNILETERLSLREFTADDAAFVFELVNEPSFIQNIGDRGVRTLADALRYIEAGPVSSYARNGFGLYLVTLKESDESIGMCGLIKRDALNDVDIGYVYLPKFWSKGYAVAPSLAGQDAQYFIAAMKSYKDGSRSDASMKAPAASLDESVIKDMAAYYANQAPQAPKVRKPMTTAEMAQRCDRCHGVGGNSTDPRSPALAAQRPEYLERVMRAYQKGERKSKAMAAMLDGLSEADIAALAGYYASQRARSVVYVPLPSK